MTNVEISIVRMSSSSLTNPAEWLDVAAFGRTYGNGCWVAVESNGMAALEAAYHRPSLAYLRGRSSTVEA